MLKIKVHEDFSPEACACLCLRDLSGWSDEKLEIEMKKLGEWELYLKFKQETSELSQFS